MSIGAIAGPSALIEQVADRLEGYFFRPGGRYGIAIARISLFVGIYITYTKLPFSAGRVDTWYSSVSQTAYRPNMPWLRLAEGLTFGLGMYLLGWFMDYWNHQWLLLLAFFVDWDYFWTRLRRHLHPLSSRSFF